MGRSETACDEDVDNVAFCHLTRTSFLTYTIPWRWGATRTASLMSAWELAKPNHTLKGSDRELGGLRCRIVEYFRCHLGGEVMYSTDRSWVCKEGLPGRLTRPLPDTSVANRSSVGR